MEAEPLNRRLICFQTYTLARRSYSQISSLIELTCFGDVVFVHCFFFIGCGRYSLLVSTKFLSCFCRLTIVVFVLFVLCVRMKIVALHCVKMFKNNKSWFCFIYITYRFKSLDKINASFCIFISLKFSKLSGYF